MAINPNYDETVWLPYASWYPIRKWPKAHAAITEIVRKYVLDHDNVDTSERALRRRYEALKHFHDNQYNDKLKEPINP